MTTTTKAKKEKFATCGCGAKMLAALERCAPCQGKLDMETDHCAGRHDAEPQAGCPLCASAIARLHAQHAAKALTRREQQMADLDYDQPPCPGDIRLRRGDVVQGRYMVEEVTPSGAYVWPLTKKQRDVELATGAYDADGNPVKVKRTFSDRGRKVQISNTAHTTDVQRLGEQGFQDFLAGKFERQGQDNNNIGQNGDNMAGKKKTKKGAAAGNGEAQVQEGTTTKGKLGTFDGHSITSVLRALGQDGVTVAHARAISKKQGWGANDTTVTIQVGRGRRIADGKGKKDDGVPADLTKEQLKSLKDSAEAPADEPKAEKKPKAKKDKPAKATKAKKGDDKKPLPRGGLAADAIREQRGEPNPA